MVRQRDRYGRGEVVMVADPAQKIPAAALRIAAVRRAVPALQTQRTADVSILRALADNESSQRNINDLLQIIASEDAELAKQKNPAAAL